MKTRKTRSAFIIGLALLGATTFLTLPSCGGSQQSQKAATEWVKNSTKQI